MAIKARLADGTTLSFPDGTDDAVIDRAVQQHVGGGKSEAARVNMNGGTFGGVTNRAANAMTFGLADEAAGIGSALSNALVSPFRSSVDFNPAKAYARGKTQYQADEAAAGRDAPMASGAADVIGLLGGLGAPTKAIKGAGTMLGRVKAGAKAGAGFGALGGFGNANGAVESAAGAVVGGLAGLGVGAAFPVAASMIARPIRGALGFIGKNPNLSRQIVANALKADGFQTGGAAGAAMDAASRRGVPAFLADQGENLRALAGSVSRQPGPSRTLLRNAVVERQAGQADRVTGAIARDLGAISNPRTVSAELLQRARAESAPLYDTAYSAPMAETDALKGILGRIPAKAIENAKALARLEGRDPNDLGVEINAAGETIFTQKPSMQTLDYIKRGMDDVVEKYRDGTTGKLNLDTQGNAVNGVLRDLINEVDRLNPAYKAARAAYAGPVRASAAMSKGASALNKSADDIMAETKGMSPFELEHYRLGVRRSMANLMDAKSDGADKIAALINSPKKRKALQQAFGDSGGFDNFMATLGDEAKAGETYRAIATGSPTANRMADDALNNDAGLIETAAGRVARGATNGGLSGALVEALGALRDIGKFGAGASGERARQQIAALLSETDPALLAEALKQATATSVNARVARRAGDRAAVVGGNFAGRASGGTIGAFARPQPVE
jgi:hypothetical protein